MKNSPLRQGSLIFLTVLGIQTGQVAHGQLTLRVEDYAEMPMTGRPQFPSATANSAYLARPNFLAEEPGGTDRFFVNDLNGPLYILDKTTGEFTTYLDFNGRDSRRGLFEKFTFAGGYANGLITFQFDPDYANNGKFYTVHMEEPNVNGSRVPANDLFPGFDNSGYQATSSVDAPGGADRETVLIEWTDNDVSDSSFEGSARELLRLDMVSRIHPLGDILFNPLAGPGDADWRVMYLAVGDGGAGARGNDAIRKTPQRLDTYGGKILRIISDLDLHTDTSSVSNNGRYRIPDDNPFVDVEGALGELWAVGLRNPHRISWDVDPDNSAQNYLITNDIGQHTWEEVNILRSGENYGYSEREGNELMLGSNQTTGLPVNDEIPWQVDENTTAGTVVPTYPVVQYGHDPSDEFFGDAISSGYVYRGDRIPALYGKYIFGDISTGQLFYADFEEMLAADDGDPETLASIHAIDLFWDNPADATDGEELYPSLFPIVTEAYHARGGQDPNLPGSAAATNGLGRADIRIQLDADGELFFLSKSDGMVRAVFAPRSGVPGDYNNNGVTEQGDLDLVLLNWGQDISGVSLDWNHQRPDSGLVDQQELDTVLLNWGRTTPLGAASVPEPASAVLLLLALFASGLLLGRSSDRIMPFILA